MNARTEALLRSAVVCDLTLPFEASEWEGRENVLDRFCGAGINYVSLTVGSDARGTGPTVHNLANVRRLIEEKSDRMTLATTVAAIRAAKSVGKLALGFHFQGSLALESNPNLVALYYDLGVRHMLLAYNQMNAAASGCHERVDAGLSRYGWRLVLEMNRVGMIIDCTHTGYRSSMEIMEASTAPVIFSHSNAHTICPHERNIKDEQARACAKSGGVVGVTGVGKFLSTRGTAEVANMMEHIVYLADLLGVEQVALGIDHVYFLEQHYRTVSSNPETWPSGYPPPPWHYFEPEQLPALIDALGDHGFSDADIRGVLGENFLRVAKEVWK